MEISKNCKIDFTNQPYFHEIEMVDFTAPLVNYDGNFIVLCVMLLTKPQNK